MGTGDQTEVLGRLVSRVATLEAAAGEAEAQRRSLHNQLVELRGNVSPTLSVVDSDWHIPLWGRCNAKLAPFQNLFLGSALVGGTGVKPTNSKSFVTTMLRDLA